jgi:hypothetical protein
MKYAIKSPKSTKIKVCGTEFKYKVKKGDILFELYDYEEQRILSEITKSIEENNIKRVEASGNFVSSKISKLREISDLRGSALSASQVAYVSLCEQYRVGQVTMFEVIRGRQDISIRSHQILQSVVEAEIYSRNQSDSLAVFDIIECLLRNEYEYVERSASRLRIVAPEAGRFERYVDVGTPVRLGHLLGQIN